MGNGRPRSQSANAFQIQRSDGVEKPRPQSIYILDPGTGWLVEHHHDHQYPAKEVVARYRNSGWPERISAADRGYLKSYFPDHKLPCLGKIGLGIVEDEAH